MNQQELQIQLSTQLPNVLCSMIADYSKFKTLSLLPLYEEEEGWRDLLEHLGTFPTNTRIRFIKMDKMDKLQLRVQQVYYFHSFGEVNYRETDVLVKLENGCYACMEYSRYALWAYEKLEVYLSTTIEELLNSLSSTDLTERVWAVQ